MVKKLILTFLLIFVPFLISAKASEGEVDECFLFCSEAPPIPKEICYHILSFTSASDYFNIREVNHGFDTMIRYVDDDIYALQKTYQALQINTFPDDENDNHDRFREILNYSAALLEIKKSLLPFEKKRIKEEKNDFRKMVFERIANHPLMVTYCIKRQPFPSCLQDLLLENIRKIPNFDAMDLKRIRKPLALLSVLVANKIKDRYDSPIHHLISSLRLPLKSNEEPAFKLLYPEGVQSILSQWKFEENQQMQIHFAHTFLAIGDFSLASIFFLKYVFETKKQDDLGTTLKIAYLMNKAHKYGKGVKYYKKAFQIAEDTKITLEPQYYIKAGLCCYRQLDFLYPIEASFNQDTTRQGISYFERALQMGAKLTASTLDKFQEMKEDFLDRDEKAPMDYMNSIDN